MLKTWYSAEEQKARISQKRCEFWTCARHNQTKPIFPAPRGATETMRKPLVSASVFSDEEFLRLPLEKAQAFADPQCTICLGDGTYGKGTQLLRCDCSRAQRGGGG